jgi:flagellar hook assembly protein FlgD
VTATDPVGSATLTSPSVKDPPAPKISGLKQSHKRWRRGGKLATITRKRAPVGDTFTFKLTADAKLTLTFTHKVHGRKRTAGKLTFKTAHAGKRKVKFQGRLSHHRKLKPGTYTLKITASNPSGHSTSKGITFTIVA